MTINYLAINANVSIARAGLAHRSVRRDAVLSQEKGGKPTFIHAHDFMQNQKTLQWCKVTKYIYLSTVLEYTFEEFVL